MPARTLRKPRSAIEHDRPCPGGLIDRFDEASCRAFSAGALDRQCRSLGAAPGPRAPARDRPPPRAEAGRSRSRTASSNWPPFMNDMEAGWMAPRERSASFRASASMPGMQPPARPPPALAISTASRSPPAARFGADCSQGLRHPAPLEALRSCPSSAAMPASSPPAPTPTMCRRLRAFWSGCNPSRRHGLASRDMPADHRPVSSDSTSAGHGHDPADRGPAHARSISANAMMLGACRAATPYRKSTKRPRRRSPLEAPPRSIYVGEARVSPPREVVVVLRWRAPHAGAPVSFKPAGALACADLCGAVRARIHFWSHLIALLRSTSLTLRDSRLVFIPEAGLCTVASQTSSMTRQTGQHIPRIMPVWPQWRDQ